MYKTDTYDLVVDMETGTDESGNVIDKSADLYTCVYDVRDKRTVDFLRSNVIPKVQALNQKMAVVGVGLEYRGSREPGIVGQGTTQVFGNAYACPATETILCSGVSESLYFYHLIITEREVLNEQYYPWFVINSCRNNLRLEYTVVPLMRMFPRLLTRRRKKETRRRGRRRRRRSRQRRRRIRSDGIS